MQSSVVISILAYLLMLVGLLGAVLPVLPGAPLIWLGALVWAWNDGFHGVGVPTLIALAVLAALSWATDLAISTYSTRRAGAGWKSVAAAIACGLGGAVLLGGAIPILGALIGTLIEASFGIVLVEYLATPNWRLARRATAAYVIGYLAASLCRSPSA